MRSATRPLALLLGLLGAAGCAEDRVVIDPSLAPSAGTIRDGAGVVHELAAAQDEGGVVSEFVADELIVSASPAELTALLARTGAVVIDSDAVPPPPPELGASPSPEAGAPRSYLLRVAPGPADLGRLGADLDAAYRAGPLRVSSEAAARLLALAAREAGAGARVGPNFFLRPQQSFLFSTRERSDGMGGNDDAFGYGELGPLAERSRITAAWQFVAAHGVARRAKVAIIDAGFWLDDEGHPRGGDDLPRSPPQYDFFDVPHDRFAGGDNPSPCSGLLACRYHGNGCASLAAAAIDNSYGAAGAGAQVTTPILLRVLTSDFQVRSAVRTAREWGADVISMSFGGPCNRLCRGAAVLSGYYRPFVEAQEAGVAMVASAGNRTTLGPITIPAGDVDELQIQPCTLPGVICVGALAAGSNRAADYSYFGAGVDLWAPGTVRAMPDGESNGALVTFSGTSASAPLVAGVLAMMKAMDPGLRAEDLLRILRETAWTDSPSEPVRAYLDAFRAVRRAAGDRLPIDPGEEGAFPGQSADDQLLDPLQGLTTRTLHDAADRDWVTFYLRDVAYFAAELTYMLPLGDLDPLLAPAGSNLPVSLVLQATATGMTLAGPPLTAGAYRLRIQRGAGDGPNLYKLALRSVYLPPGPDRFEPNDTLLMPRNPGLGGNDATLHLAADPDHYIYPLVFPAGGDSDFLFEVDGAGDPGALALTLFDPLSNVAATSDRALRLSGAPPRSGAYTVRVTGDRVRRYFFRGVGVLKPEVLQGARLDPPPAHIIKLDPGDVRAGWLIDEADYHAFLRSAKYPRLHLQGAGLRAGLLLRDGKPVGAAVTTGPPGAEATDLDTAKAGVAEGEYLLLRLTRAAAGRPLPPLPYRVALQPGGDL